MVEVTLIDGVAPVRLLAREREHLVERGLRLDRHHVPARGHHLVRLDLAEFEAPLRQQQLCCREQSRSCARFHDELEFVRRQRRLPLAHGPHPCQPGHPHAHPVQEPDEGAEDAGEYLDGRGHEKRRPLGSGQRDVLRRQLPEHDQHRRDEDERHRYRDRVGSGRPQRVPQQVLQPGLDQARERWLAHPAEPEARHGDPQLRRRDAHVEPLQRAQQYARARMALARELLDLRASHGDIRELGRDKEAVRSYERDNGQQANDDRDIRHGRLLRSSMVRPALLGAAVPGPFR